MFTHDTTLSKSGSSIGNTQRNVNKVMQFANDEKMDMNGRKCKEMLIDLCRNKTELPPISLDENQISRVQPYKLLGMLLDNDLKWTTSTYCKKTPTKRHYLLKILRSCGDLRVIY